MQPALESKQLRPSHLNVSIAFNWYGAVLADKLDRAHLFEECAIHVIVALYMSISCHQRWSTMSCTSLIWLHNRTPFPSTLSRARVDSLAQN